MAKATTKTKKPKKLAAEPKADQEAQFQAALKDLLTWWSEAAASVARLAEDVYTISVTARGSHTPLGRCFSHSDLLSLDQELRDVHSTMLAFAPQIALPGSRVSDILDRIPR